MGIKMLIYITQVGTKSEFMKPDIAVNKSRK